MSRVTNAPGLAQLINPAKLLSCRLGYRKDLIAATVRCGFVSKLASI